MKILVFNAKDSEMKYLEDWAQRKQVQLDYRKYSLKKENIDEIEGYDSICLHQSKHLKDEEIYKKIASYGMKHIATRSIGVDMFDFDLAEKYGIEIYNTAGYSPSSVAEYSIMLGLMLVRNYKKTMRAIETRNFAPSVDFLGREIGSMTVGVIGLGNIGMTAAKKWHGLGAKVIGYNRSPKEVDFLEMRKNLDEIFEEADLVSLHLPLTEETYHMVDERRLGLMKKGSYLVNTSRGDLVDTKALIEALESGHLAGAGLDVLEKELEIFANKDVNEEVIANHYYGRLEEMDQAIVTQHIAYFTDNAVRDMVNISLDSIYKNIKQ